MKISLLPLILLLCAITAQAQSSKKTAKPYIVANVPGVPGPERLTGEKFNYSDDEAHVVVLRWTQGQRDVSVYIHVTFKLATSERSQSQQEVFLLGGAIDDLQKVNEEDHRIEFGDAKQGISESYRVSYYADGSKIASMDAMASYMGNQAKNRAIRFMRLAYASGQRSEIKK